MRRITACLGLAACLALGAQQPVAAQFNPFAPRPAAPARPPAPTYQVQFSRMLAVIPSTSDPLGISAAIASQFPFPVVGYVTDQMGNAIALTSEKVAAQLNTYKAMADANGTPVRLLDFQRWAHLNAPQSIENELKERAANMLRGNTISNVMYGAKRPPDQVYLTYDGPNGPTPRTYCSLPLLNCGSKYYSMNAGTLRELMNEQGSIGGTNRRMAFYLWDSNPIIADKRLGGFQIDVPAEAGKGWNVAIIEGGASTDSSIYLIEYCVLKPGEKVESCDTA